MIRLAFAWFLVTLTAACGGDGGSDDRPLRGDVPESGGVAEDVTEADPVPEVDAAGPEDVDEEPEPRPDVDDAEAGAEVEVGPFCTPGLRECVDDANYRRCVEDGSAWGEPEPCPDDRYCEEGRCVASDCVPQVMFVVDGSDSMLDEWAAVRSAIATVTSNNPGVSFGITVFPDGPGCSIGNGEVGPFGYGVLWPNVSIQPGAGAVLDAWMRDNEPVVRGGTPLVETIEWLAENANAVWGELLQNGYMVVMSEGADICRCDLDEVEDCMAPKLAEATAGLLERGVRTYVVGYRYEDAPGALNAIAENGGTVMTEFIPAGDEEALTDAFEIVIEDVKLCD